MPDDTEPRYIDSSRLKQVNLELGQLASKHKACRLNSGLFSGLGAVILAISLVGLVNILPSGSNDWAQNPDSPVYELAVQNENLYTLKVVLVSIGFVVGLGFIVNARRQCVMQRGLWQREGDLRKEMRTLRDQLYVVDRKHPGEPHPKRAVEHPQPLDADEARGEYVGVYNPPSGRQEASSETA